MARKPVVKGFTYISCDTAASAMSLQISRKAMGPFVLSDLITPSSALVIIYGVEQRMEPRAVGKTWLAYNAVCQFYCCALQAAL